MTGSLLRGATRAALAAALVLGLAYLGVPRALGAHPFWDVKIAWIGAPVGAGLGVALAALNCPRTRTALWLTALMLVALGFALYGKTVFAASYAEDRLAGQFWFFGWIATTALATATAATAFQPLSTSRPN